MDLSYQHQRFVSEYLVDRNATQAAVRAGYSQKCARQVGSRLLTYVDVRASVAQQTAETAKRLKIEREDILRGLQAAFAEAQAQGRPMEMIAACREMGRLLGYYDNPPPEPSWPEATDRIESLPDSALLAVIRGR